jgi:hypothetical protein
MTAPQAVLRLAAAAVLCMLASCIDATEEVWLEADGSGRTEIHYDLPAAAARLQGGEAGVRQMIEDFLKRTPEITSSHAEVTKQGDRLHVRVRAAFDSALDLQAVAEGSSFDELPSAASHLAGVVEVDFRGRRIDFSRTITPSKALPGSFFMPSSQFEGRRLVYTMHLPAAVLSSNATRTENSGRTLVWDMPLAEAVKTPIVQQFQMDAPIPWKLVSGVAIPVTFALGALLVLRFRRSQASARDPGPTRLRTD